MTVTLGTPYPFCACAWYYNPTLFTNFIPQISGDPGSDVVGSLSNNKTVARTSWTYSMFIWGCDGYFGSCSAAGQRATWPDGERGLVCVLGGG